MKKLFIASVLTFAAFGTASANFSIPGVSSTNLELRIDEGIATIFGDVESGSEKALAKSYVADLEGVDKVIDLVTHN